MIQTKMIIYAVILILLSSAIGGAFWYFKWSQKEISILKENITKLEIANKEQRKTIEFQKKDSENRNKQISLVNDKFKKARQENIALRDKLAKHNIGYLASKKPKLVQKVINKGTADVGRCLELLSGAERTTNELSATKKSQLNSSCPEIANPNREVK